MQALEPHFLSHALAQGSKLRIGQMNKTEHEGILREIGRYEINIEEKDELVTILKRDISCLTLPIPYPLTTSSAAAPSATAAPEEPSSIKPNIQQEFLDRAIREKQVLTVFLISGQRIKATIQAYDNFTILLSEGGQQHLYYKHAITTMNR